MSVVIGGISGPGWCQQPDPTGTSPVTASARTYTTLRDSIGGFESTAHFSKVFRAHFGCSPVSQRVILA
jgi:hypothetical protein